MKRERNAHMPVSVDTERYCCESARCNASPFSRASRWKTKVFGYFIGAFQEKRI